MFSWGSFSISGFKWRSLVHLELTFVYNDTYEFNLILLHVNIQILWHNLLKIMATVRHIHVWLFYFIIFMSASHICIILYIAYITIDLYILYIIHITIYDIYILLYIIYYYRSAIYLEIWNDNFSRFFFAYYSLCFFFLFLLIMLWVFAWN